MERKRNASHVAKVARVSHQSCTPESQEDWSSELEGWMSGVSVQLEDDVAKRRILVRLPRFVPTWQAIIWRDALVGGHMLISPAARILKHSRRSYRCSTTQSYEVAGERSPPVEIVPLAAMYLWVPLAAAGSDNFGRTSVDTTHSFLRTNGCGYNAQDLSSNNGELEQARCSRSCSWWNWRFSKTRRNPLRVKRGPIWQSGFR